MVKNSVLCNIKGMWFLTKFIHDDLMQPSMLMKVRTKLNKVIWLMAHVDKGRTMLMLSLKMLVAMKI